MSTQSALQNSFSIHTFTHTFSASICSTFSVPHHSHTAMGHAWGTVTLENGCFFTNSSQDLFSLCDLRRSTDSTFLRHRTSDSVESLFLFPGVKKHWRFAFKLFLLYLFPPWSQSTELTWASTVCGFIWVYSGAERQTQIDTHQPYNTEANNTILTQRRSRSWLRLSFRGYLRHGYHATCFNLYDQEKHRLIKSVILRKRLASNSTFNSAKFFLILIISEQASLWAAANPRQADYEETTVPTEVCGLLWFTVAWF